MPEVNEYQDDVYFSHFTQQVSQDIVNYTMDVAFKWSRYIFTQRKGKKQYGYCTYCKKEFQTNGLKHNDNAICPGCNSTCVVKASGRGRKTMVDEVYFVYYEKSVKNPQVIVARGIYAVRDYRFDYRWVDTQYMTNALYVFEPGNPRMLKRYVYFSHQYGECRVGNWDSCKSVFSLFNHEHIKNIHTCCSYESIHEAVKDTSYRWSSWESYRADDMVKFFDLFAKYPSVEYLTKLGMKTMVDAKLNGHNTYSAINWRGKTLLKVLRLNKQDLKELKTAEDTVDPLFLRLFQISKKDKSNLTFTEISEIRWSYACYFQELQKVLKYTTLRKVNWFINKQYQEKNKYLTPDNKTREHYRGQYQVLSTWNDYIADCLKLEMDLSNEMVLYPRNLYTAHQNTITQVKVKENEEFNKKISSRAKALKRYSFEYLGLIIRPAASSKELIDEGKTLNHCVGTYAERYARGETSIFFIRKANKPNKPYFTVEIRKDAIYQVRGKNNCSPNKVVEKFIKAFEAEKFSKEKGNKKTRIAVPA